VHVSPAQQPPSQLCTSQVHCPFAQRWPAAQGAPVPQRQAPPAQLSARSGSQATHTAPPVPQRPRLAGLHVEPVQQPLGHAVALQPSHAPPSQCCPAGQAAHCEPLAPHD
jgi:hypothetical protein